MTRFRLNVSAALVAIAAIALLFVSTAPVSGLPQDVIVGGHIRLTGPTTARTYTLPDANAYLLSGTAAAKKVTGGLHTSVAAADTVVTGLATVTSCVATYATDPADANLFVSCTVGDQAGTPAAGSIIIKTWKSADGTDPTPVAATTFSKAVNWIAYGG